MEKIIVSIIVPIYKVEKYLDKCVQSLMRQSYPNLEIILVDDGSPDGCPQMCDLYAKMDSRIKVLHKVNGGLSDARNSGMNIATGSYVLFVDSDDYIELDAIQALVPFMKSNYDIITTEGITEGGKNDLSHSVIDGKVYIGADYVFKELSAGKMPNAAWLNAYRVQYLREEKLCFKYGILHEDVEFTPRAFLKANSVVDSGVLMYHYIIRDDSIMTRKDKRKNALDLHNTCLELKEIYESVENNMLKKLLLDSLSVSMLFMFQQGRLYMYGKEYIFKEFIRENAQLPRTKKKAFLYCVSPRLYWYINYFIKKYSL